jgi:hypothetical protein
VPLAACAVGLVAITVRLRLTKELR